MSEMSDMFKLVNAMELAKKAKVGMELTLYDVIELLGELESLYDYIAELKAERRWRVIADGELPEHDGEYWVWLEAWNTPDKRGACIYSKDYHDNNGFFNLIPVTHWMPLPKPPEGV